MLTDKTKNCIVNGLANKDAGAEVIEVLETSSTSDHTHSNKAILDSITEAFTTALKSAYDAAVADAHTHANQATLDLIEEAFTTALKTTYDSALQPNGISGTFITADVVPQTITVSNGLITNIA